MPTHYYALFFDLVNLTDFAFIWAGVTAPVLTYTLPMLYDTSLPSTLLDVITEYYVQSEVYSLLIVIYIIDIWSLLILSSVLWESQSVFF